MYFSLKKLIYDLDFVFKTTKNQIHRGFQASFDVLVLKIHCSLFCPGSYHPSPFL
jgi:hypothetical protein